MVKSAVKLTAVGSNLNKSDPLIYKSGKIMLYMSFRYGEYAIWIPLVFSSKHRREAFYSEKRVRKNSVSTVQ